MKRLAIEVIGTNPPCSRCNTTLKIAEQAASMLREEGYDVTVTKLDILDKNTVKKYGVVVSPAIAVNGIVKIMGKVPGVHFLSRLLREQV